MITVDIFSLICADLECHFILIQPGGFANLVTPPSLHRKDMTDAQTNLPGLLLFFFFNGRALKYTAFCFSDQLILELTVLPLK